MDEAELLLRRLEGHPSQPRQFETWEAHDGTRYVYCDGQWYDWEEFWRMVDRAKKMVVESQPGCCVVGQANFS